MTAPASMGSFVQCTHAHTHAHTHTEEHTTIIDMSQLHVIDDVITCCIDVYIHCICVLHAHRLMWSCALYTIVTVYGDYIIVCDYISIILILN